MSHVTPAELIELFCGDAPDGDALDAHVFECEACGVAYARLGELCATLRTVIPPVVSPAYCDRMVASGTKVVRTPVQSGVPVTAVFAADLDLLIHSLRGDFANASRIDLSIMSPDRSERIDLEHVPFGPTEVLIACQRHYRHLFGGGNPTFVLTVTEGASTRESSYLVLHQFPEESP